MSHMPYLWAAYRRGTVHELPEGLSQDQFKDALFAVFNRVDEAYVLLAEIKGKGQIPVGVGIVKVDDTRAWPHTWWFPEATARDKLEITARYVVELRKRFLLLITCSDKHKPFFVKLCKLGLLRRVGTVHNWSEDGAVALFESKVTT